MNPVNSPTAGAHLGTLQGAYGSQSDLDRIARDDTKSESQKVGELAMEFEAMLFKQIIKGMQKSLGGSSMFPTQGPASIYGDMMMDSLAHSISQSSQLGLAKTFQNQITNNQVTENGESEHHNPATTKAKEDK